MSWRRFVLCFLTLSVAGGLAQKSRISGEADRSRTVSLVHQVHPYARTLNDEGPVDPSLELNNLILQFRPSATQQAELEVLLAGQYTPGSPSYQKWLTPDEFGLRFGVSPDDVARISGWLEGEGFQVEHVARGRQWISFRGTAQQVERSFRTQIRQFSMNGRAHFANISEPSVPAAFGVVIAAIRGFNDFLLLPGRVKSPNLTAGFTSASGRHTIAPEDLSTIYNIAPLYKAGIDGTGMNLVVAGQSDIALSDIRSFRTTFGLPANDPVTKLLGRNPGKTADQDEASLDLEWAGAVAPKANIIYALSNNVITSAQYAVDQNFGPVITISYGGCEQLFDTTIQAIAQQANAQGITMLAATGDTGAASCDAFRGSVAQASTGRTVNLPASIPEVTAVGGTMFSEGSGTFWNGANSGSGGSALSYIPEVAWNETDLTGFSSTGGGASILFRKPLWQTGPGVPDDGVRDLPDVSMSSAIHDAYQVFSGGTPFGVGGTSVASPVFAGVVTLLNQYLISQKVISKPGLGNINPALYRLAQSSPSVFHDITQGDNMVPCVQGSPDCVDGSLGYKAGPGYDLVTGLGSVDVNNLVTQWDARGIGTTLSLSATAASVAQNGVLSLTATVKADDGSVPSGAVNFGRAGTPLGSAALTGGDALATATFVVNTAALSLGSANFTATYDGASRWNGSGASVSVAVTARAGGSWVVPTITPTPVLQNPLSGAWNYSVRLRESAGVATTITSFTIDGVDSLSLLPQTSLAALGSTTVALAPTGLAAPISRLHVFTGRDADGTTWSQQVPVFFYGPTIAFSLQLSASSSTIYQDPGADASCQWAQAVSISEIGGYGVQLTRFTLGTNDLTSRLQTLFGTTRLAPFGTLQGTVCVPSTMATAGQTMSYSLRGTADIGSVVTASLLASFRAPVDGPVKLAVSQTAINLRAATAADSAEAKLAIQLPGNAQTWTASIAGSVRTTGWLRLSATSGTGPSELSISTSATGLSRGAYNATLVIQSPNALPSAVSVPVVFVVGNASTTAITGVAHGASFKTVFAPGMIMSVFGTQLAPSAQQASGTPLPLSLAGVSATVNGASARLYFVSPGQLNIQVPYETSAGLAVLAVNNNGNIATFPFQVQPAAPGIFTSAGAALVPYSASKAAQILLLFMTGEGDTNTPVNDGETPASGTSVSRLPKPRLPVVVTVGGVNATVQFVGIPSGLVGVTQINFAVPDSVAPGTQPVVVTVGGVASEPAFITVTP